MNQRQQVFHLANQLCTEIHSSQIPELLDKLKLLMEAAQNLPPQGGSDESLNVLEWTVLKETLDFFESAIIHMVSLKSLQSQ